MTELPKDGKVVVCRPELAEKAKEMFPQYEDRIVAKEFCPPGKVYILDLDYLTRWP